MIDSEVRLLDPRHPDARHPTLPLVPDAISGGERQQGGLGLGTQDFETR